MGSEHTHPQDPAVQFGVWPPGTHSFTHIIPTPLSPTSPPINPRILRLQLLTSPLPAPPGAPALSPGHHRPPPLLLFLFPPTACPQYSPNPNQVTSLWPLLTQSTLQSLYPQTSLLLASSPSLHSSLSVSNTQTTPHTPQGLDSLSPLPSGLG